jgi:hypothetical protein
MTHEHLLAEHQPNRLKMKHEYLKSDGNIDRHMFRHDLLGQAFSQNISVPRALAIFFSRETFSQREMGSFALDTSATGNLIEGALALFHALEITAEQATEERVLETYFGVSNYDPQMRGASWTIDAGMNWPPGTSLPSSKQELEKF